MKTVKLILVTFFAVLVVAGCNSQNQNKKAASVGHDTEKYKADDDVYASLPGCCHYERWN